MIIAFAKRLCILNMIYTLNHDDCAIRAALIMRVFLRNCKTKQNKQTKRQVVCNVARCEEFREGLLDSNHAH